MKRTCILAVALSMVAGLAAGQPTQPTQPTSAPLLQRLVTLQGEVLEGKLLDVTRRGSSLAVMLPRMEVRFAAAGKERFVALEDLRMIQFAPAEARLVPGQKLIRLQSGQAILADRLEMEGGRLNLLSPVAGKIVAEISSVRTIVLPAANQSPQEVLREFAALNLPTSSQDVLLAVDKKGQAAPYPGIFKGIDGGKVSFELESVARTTDLANVRLIELAGTGGGQRPRGEIVLRDGSAVPFDEVAMASGTWTVHSPGLSVLPLDGAKLAELRVFSDKLSYLSDLSPLHQEQAGTFDEGMGFARDRSTTGQAIRLGGASYSRGLGLHSRCSLAYSLDGKYSLLLAKAGIDDNAARAGKAVLTITADGKKLLDAKPFASGQAPLDLRLDVRGAKELTILVDFSPDGLDVGGHVDLADAVLVR